MKNIKDKSTDIMAIAVILAEVFYELLISNEPFDLKQMIAALLLAFILYATGKSHNLKKKPKQLVEMQDKVITKSAGIPDTTVGGKEQDADPPKTPPDLA